MAGGAFTFAEILRDEYLYLHGEVPQFRAQVQEKHLRELSSLVLRVKAAPDNGVRRHSLLKQYGKLDGTNDHAVVTQAFQKLLETEFVITDDHKHPLTLFEALLRDEDVAGQLRSPEILRKLAGIPVARRMIFQDTVAAARVGSMTELCDMFCSASAAVRLLIKDDSDFFTRFPALLATIADDRELDVLLSQGNDAKSKRDKLRAIFTDDESGFFARLPFGGSRLRTQSEKWEASKYADAVRALLDGKKPPADPQRPPIPVDSLTIFNSFLLETTFIECFTDSYDVRSMNQALHEKDMAALCLSGGGIRSATFNLGILQGLADHGLLAKFHYLSSVSGGGYIASWFSSWVRRHNEGMEGVAKDLTAPPADPEEPEVRPIRHLRAYSSYLAPRSSLLALDTWTIAATYVRNLLLNWTILIPLIALVLALPRLMETATLAAWKRGDVHANAGYTALILSSLAVMLVALARPRTEKRSGGEKSADALRLESLGTRIWLVPLAISAIAFCLFWASLHALPANDPLREWMIDGWMLPAFLAAGSALAGAVYAGRRIGSLVPGGNAIQRIVAFAKMCVRWSEVKRAFAETAAAAFAGFFAGLLLRTFFAKFFPPDLLGLGDSYLYFEQYVCFAIPLFLLVFFVEATMLVGFTTLGSSDHDREWWARSAALMFLTATFYLAGAAVVLFVATLMAQLPQILAPIGGITGVISWVLAKAEKAKPDSRSDEDLKAKIMSVALKLAATLTLFLLLALIVLGTTWVLSIMQTVTPSSLTHIFRWKAEPLAKLHIGALQGVTRSVLTDFIFGSLAVAALMSWLLNVNVYSMHGMYRNRLIRAYLGASRWFRRPDAFTGFDAQDNVDMFELRAEALWTSSIIDFQKFASTLAAKQSLFDLLPGTVQDRLVAFVKGPKRPPIEEIRSEVVRALNELMVTHDLRNAVKAPRSIQIFIENRKYLDELFAASIVPRPLDERKDPAKTTAVVPAPQSLPQASSESARTEEEERVYAEIRALRDSCTPERRRPPLHVVNAALNLVGGENLAWQERKADSFTMSPLHCGNRRLGYRDSYDYGEHISLGTALAISGAAVSPNMGYHSSPPVTFLMTLFNARLGWWLGNPSQKKYEKPGPSTTMASLMAEAFGATNDTNDWVFLSDGGHFDNLGIYEMVRRRCHYIVVCDATADGKYAFGDLGNAVRKVRIDMGIPISLRTAYLAPEPGQKEGRYCALGLIHYGDVDDVPHQWRFGYLLYIKPAVYTECPADVRNYKNQSQTFPHESTVDQFFGESQFESYRALGRHIVGQICNDRLDVKATQAPSVGAFMSLANDYIDARATPTGNANVHSIADLVKWMQRSLG